MENNQEKIYLPGLNGIRAIAAMIVLFWHIYQFFPMFGLSGKENPISGFGVTLFFVLSGYLITYLLLKEKKAYSNISIRNFYIRRILRIWPLYFFAIGLSILLIPFLTNIETPKFIFKSYLFYFLLLPNIPFALNTTISIITPLWSIGVEEQFYAFWPIVFKKSKNILIALIIVFLIFLCTKFYFRFTHNNLLYSYFVSTRIHCMALGAIGAFWVLSGQLYKRIVFHPVVQVICWLHLLVSGFTGVIHIFSVLDHEIYALIYLIIILNVSTNPKTIISLENRLFDFVGKISYGIYVYHMFIITMLAFFLKNKFQDNLVNKTFIYLLIISISIIIAWISYETFEKRFLKMKAKFSKILSTNTKRN
jgi:peptidoglycan/LPS O-acetylase OafA/YrhL